MKFQDLVDRIFVKGCVQLVHHAPQAFSTVSVADISVPETSAPKDSSMRCLGCQCQVESSRGRTAHCPTSWRVLEWMVAVKHKGERDMSLTPWTEEHRSGDYVISTDKTKLDVPLISEYLSRRSYWARGRTLTVVEKSIEHSLCFGVYRGKEQVGFARVVTDHATFAWLCDVFILESHRRKGLGKWLIDCVTAHPDLKGLRLFLLATRDAHDLYRRYGGFESLEAPEKWMIRQTG